MTKQIHQSSLQPQKIPNNTVDGNEEKLELSYITGGNVKWCSHFGKV